MEDRPQPAISPLGDGSSSQLLGLAVLKPDVPAAANEESPRADVESAWPMGSGGIWFDSETVVYCAPQALLASEVALRV
jgi:hypothetical protein